MHAAKNIRKLSKPLNSYRKAMDTGNFDKAVEFASTMIKLMPDGSDVYACRGEAHLRCGRYIDASNDFAMAHTLDPQQVRYLTQFASSLRFAGELEGAESCFRAALQLDSGSLAALLGIAEVLEAQGRLKEAGDFLVKAITQHPTSAIAFHQAGRFNHYFGDRQDAAQFLAQAIKLDPRLPEPYRVLGAFLREVKNYEESIALYDAALKHVPNDPVCLAERAHTLSFLSEWDAPGYRDFDVGSEGIMGSAQGPFLFLPLEDNPERLLKRCTAFGKAAHGRGVETPIKVPSNEKVRIGYVSSDFHEHATMHLLAGMLEAHDRDKFEIIAYSLGKQSDDRLRRRAVAAVDRFVDISSMSEFGAAELIRADELDIAVDLKGFTSGTRLSIFGYRIAPVHITWLGFPGSTGMDYMDYIIADNLVVPPELEHCYSEKVLRMPASYQPNDRDRPIPDPTVTRADAGLPEEGIVFGSFNSVYKVSPREFDIWLDLLEEVEGSVLWQLIGSDGSVANLRKRAEARGIDPNRIIFAPQLPQDEHLSRLAHADIFLDTFNCNAHTTASDALWAGVPVVTMPGRQFAARVAGSLASAAGTPDTICADEADYKAMALELARNTEKRLELRQRLIDGRMTCPLFDTEQFTRDFEDLLTSVRKLPK